MANKLHDSVLDFLEKYRTQHPDFIYWLRERNTNNRLNDGYWFQGNKNYAFVGLYDRGGGSNMTRSVGVVFFETGNGIGCHAEFVFNEEKDAAILKFYSDAMQMLGGFEKIKETKYQKKLSSNDGFTAAEDFLNSYKTKLDDLLNASGLSNLFISNDKFLKKLQTVEKIRKQQNSSLFPPEKTAALKAKFLVFKEGEFYKTRLRQLQFVSFAKHFIQSSLNVDAVTNTTFTNLIQGLKNGALLKTVEKCITENIEDNTVKTSLIEQFKSFDFTGYTGAGKAAVYNLTNEQLNIIKSFLIEGSLIKNIDDAVDGVVEYEEKKIPQVTKGIYSPWLYYINPQIFPIQNNSHNKFIEWCGQPTDDYPLAVKLFHEVSNILGENDLGIIDAFTHTFNDAAETTLTISKTEKMNLNTILYGPAGTGKTYTTIEKSVQIANPEFDIVNSSRGELRAEYNRLIKDGQIEFITFHQSLSYEDFIEGIKPMEPKQEDTFLKYEITDGIFKRLAERAAKVPDTKPIGFSIHEADFNKASFYKISLGDTSNSDDDQIYEWCIKNGYIGLGWGDAIDFTGKTEHDIQLMVPSLLDKFGGQAVNYFIHYLKEGDYVIVSYGNRAFRAIGKVTGSYEFKNVEGLYVHQFRKVEWLLKDVELPCEEVYNKQFSQQSIYRLDKREIKKDFFVNTKIQSLVEDKSKNYVLIIDEINRGNVSQIFGELITLIEDDKRTGNKEALSVTLPYSKKSFSVPSNLYLIGTMNTADRSVEALDTALRRRFVFEEMESKPHLLSPYYLLQKLWVKYWMVKPDDLMWDDWEQKESELIELCGLEIERKKYYSLANKYEKTDGEALWMNTDPALLFSESVEINDGIELDIMLIQINTRLKVLLTKDHSIGHAWFMEVNSLKELQDTFKNKMIPLLQEFFYNDYAKIGLVLGNAFVQQTVAGNNMFAKFTDNTEIGADYESKIIYTLVNPLEIDVEGFKSIYK
jgi:hypothetical protein